MVFDVFGYECFMWLCCKSVGLVGFIVFELMNFIFLVFV